MNVVSTHSTGIIVLMKCLLLGRQAVTEYICVFRKIFHRQSKFIFSFTTLKLDDQMVLRNN